MKMRRLAPAPAVLALVLVLAGCDTLLGPSQLYLLPDPPPPAQESDALGEELIGLNALALPEYADSPRIAYVTPEGPVTQARGEVWADPLARSGTLALARALDARTGAAVVVEPFPVEAAPTIRIEVIVDRFITDPGGLTSLTGVYRVSDLRLNGLAINREFDLAVETPPDGFPAIAAAHAAALALLADDIAAALIERWGPGGPAYAGSGGELG